MLKSIHIKNYAIIDLVEAEFESGLNIITGETGAGKSIFVEALGLILGERASPEVVRKGSEKAIVEGAFHVMANRKIRRLLGNNEIEFKEEMILRREVSVKGQSRCFINDSPAPVHVLKEVGDLLVDLHGQHEHQSLLRSESHIELLDDFGGLDGLLTEYRASYRRLNDLFNQSEELHQKEAQLREKRDLYEFQLREIDAVGPQPGEEESLSSELKILENSERLFEATSKLYQSLYEGEQAVYDQLVLARNQIEDLAAIDRGFEEIKEECASAAAIISEVTKFLQSYNSRIEFNPERLEQIRERLGQLSLLKKKYGGSLETILAHREKIAREFSLAQNFEGELERLKGEIEAGRSVCSDAAQRLSAKRRDLVQKINKSVVAELAKFGVANATFDVRVENRTLGKTSDRNGTSRAYVKLGREFFETNTRGIDFVEFYISTNVGEDPKPLAKVASGGEVSRVMLALKTILAKSDRLPLLVFDEIDVGVSGRIAQAVGKSLRNLSRFHQVVAITHLPQIAGLADAHFAVEKHEDGKRAKTVLRKLDLEERVEEVAKLMSGAEITEAGLAGARELMGMKK
ncbi:MAG: DNA repair protein RecN [Ignavibacteriales bacterium]|nr:DNA repair protein RecN [Ignavibacteriales bacterium]